MYRNLKVWAVIVAAGKSRRMGKGINKQFVSIGGSPLLAQTLSVFQNADVVDAVALVSAREILEHCTQDIIKKYDMSKVRKMVSGGEERQYSVLNGLKALEGLCDIVIIHDGARPFVTVDIIERSVEEAVAHGAAACGMPVKDTIKVVDEGSFIADTPDRSKLYAVQTPQAFRFELIYKAHMQAAEEGFIGTDDTVLIERTGMKVKIFPGSYENIKVTTPEDIYMAEAIIEYRKKGQAGE